MFVYQAFYGKFSKLFSEGNILIKTIKQKANTESNVNGREIVQSETNMPFKTHTENNWELTSRIFLVYVSMLHLSLGGFWQRFLDLHSSLRITCLHRIV